MREEDVSVEELSYELSVVLEGLLHYAGVKKSKLEEAAGVYVECIDDALENSDAQGVDEVIAIVEFIKKKYPKLFEK
ncbi:hypothetical protein CCAL13119_02575 [Campylobacter sp. RM13119]|uniref:hypothetical protein n=1 Tax=Campylobacter californiensis TaxID=1032243 RepID=UPI0014734DB0|nr:hypothetical protein [Campylobacter sp. RM13119]MBE3605844.1 hypothetical protein [Campylobacter sp. RM13119]